MSRAVLNLEPLDLRHRGAEHVIGVYLLDTDDGPALFDCGPATTVPTLREGLAERGLKLTDVRHLLLSHIHLDHAGGAGVLVREHPRLRVHVSEVGAPHLVDPSRLERSARRLYGEDFDQLWGELAPVPESNVEIVDGPVLGLDSFQAPGHANHHLAFVDAAGTALCGDAAGVRIQPARFVLPPTPPPEIDVEAWSATIDELERRSPERLALIHFGVARDVETHLASLRGRLTDWSAMVGSGASEEEFVAAAASELANAEPEASALYQHAIPFSQSYAGLERYWSKRRAIAA